MKHPHTEFDAMLKTKQKGQKYPHLLEVEYIWHYEENRCAQTPAEIINSLTDTVLHVLLPEWRSPRSTRLLSGSSPSPPYRNGFFSWWVNTFIFSRSKLIWVKCTKGCFFFSLSFSTCYSQQYWKQQASDHRPSGPEHPDHLTLFCGDSWQPLHTGVWLLGQELSCVLLGDR